MTKNETKKILRKYGSIRSLARLMSKSDPITPQAIAQWDKAPLNRAVQIEKVTNGLITKEQLRPDVFC